MSCNCPERDAWRCANVRNLADVITCSCVCHRKQTMRVLPHLVLKVRVRFGKLEYRMATGMPIVGDAGRAYADLHWIPESWWTQRPRQASQQAQRWLNSRGV